MADDEWRERFRRLLTNGDDDAAAILARFRSSADDAAFKRDANVLIARRLQEEAARFQQQASGATKTWPAPRTNKTMEMANRRALTGDVMAYFRQMLKNGDAEAQHIHDTFRSTGDRETFLASVNSYIDHIETSNGAPPPPPKIAFPENEQSLKRLRRSSASPR